MTRTTLEPPESLAARLGINRATLAVLVVTGGLGLSEELWRPFLSLHLKAAVGDVLGVSGEREVKQAALYMGVFACAVNLLEGLGYIVGGSIAHRMGARMALAVSALPMAAGFALMFASREPWAIVGGALLLGNWEALSVPAAFDIVGGELPQNRRTIAFAVQSIQKRLPKLVGPAVGGLALGAVGFTLNLSLALAILCVAVVLQACLLKRMTPKADPPQVPLRRLFREMPPDLRLLLNAEILLRWGEWFVRDFAVLYVVGVLHRSEAEAGYLLALTAVAALLTYIPVAKMIERAATPKPFIGVTFLLFALFPFCLVLLPKTGIPVTYALVIAFTVNGLRELGEPARKAMIASGFAPEVRAQSIGLYWGLRSLAFFPAPIIGYLLWDRFGPDVTFLVGGAIGLLGTALFWLRVRCEPAAL